MTRTEEVVVSTLRGSTEILGRNSAAVVSSGLNVLSYRCVDC